MVSSSLKLPVCSSSPLSLSIRSRRQAVVSNVIAPQKPHSSQAQTAQEPVLSKQQQQSSSQWGWVNLNGLKLQWPASTTLDPQQQSQHEDVHEATLAPAAMVLDVHAFLGACSDEELRLMRLLAHLSAQTYYMGQLTPSKLQRWHNLELVSTSLCCERLHFEIQPTDEEIALDGDGMAGPSIVHAMQLYSSTSGSCTDSSLVSSRADSSDASSGSTSDIAESQNASTTTPGINNVVPFPKSLGNSSAPSGGPSPAAAAAAVMSAAAMLSAQKQLAAAQAQGLESPAGAQPPAGSSESASGTPTADLTALATKRSSWNPADLVAAKLSEAASAAASAAATASAAASAAALQPLASAAGSLYAGSMNLVSTVTSSVTSTGLSSLTGFGAPTDRLLREAVAGITSAEIASSHPNSQAVKAASASTATGSKCPSEWFVCDSDVTATRYFVIQGSDSIEHWKTNLMFEPVVFEGQDTGIKVHRGAYESAQALYERFLPLVQEQIHRDPTAKVCFTGHSIGGAMAVLLMLMFVRRGVLRPQQVAPVYTFGSPGVFCDGALGACSSCSTHPATGAESCSLGTSLLSQLGLPDDVIRSVMMTRDIVPRAFSCDYTLVADLLRSWGPSWRDHSCLAGGVTGTGRRQLYVHIGRMHVLQPSPELPFITEPSSFLPLLPPKPDLYALTDRPTLAHAMHVARTRAATVRNGGALGQPADSRDQVLAAIMDCPHPLETLGDPMAYGNTGSISRYHNPDHYCMALGRVLRDRRQQAAEQLARPFSVPDRVSRHSPFLLAAEKPGGNGAPVAAGTAVDFVQR